jgi:hypothetical protein
LKGSFWSEPNAAFIYPMFSANPNMRHTGYPFTG